MNKTLVPNIDASDRQWFLVDAENQTLGRLASEVAQVLRGKNNPNYAPHLDTGDFVIIVNAEKVKVSGNKATQLFRKLKVYKGLEHPHGAQQPKVLALDPATTAS